MVILPGLTLFETISQFTSEGMRYRDTQTERKREKERERENEKKTSLTFPEN